MAKVEREGRSKSKKEKVKRATNKPPTKVIIRHLPPTMTEEEFLKQIEPMPEHEEYYFVEADWSLGYDATSRAYITLKNYDDVFLFRDRFDGYVFVDSKGSEYPAIVEFAPFQGFSEPIPKSKSNLMGTIEQEEHYQQFLIKLNQEREAAAKGGDVKIEFNLETKKKDEGMTPLLKFLANKKEIMDKKGDWNDFLISYRLGNGENDKNNGDNKKSNNSRNEDGGKKQSLKRLTRSQKRREEYEQRKRERELQKEADRLAAGGNAGGSSGSGNGGGGGGGKASEERKENGEKDRNRKGYDKRSRDKGSRRGSGGGGGGGGEGREKDRDRDRGDRHRNQRNDKKDKKKSEDITPKQIIKKPDVIVNPIVKNFFESFVAKDNTNGTTAPTTLLKPSPSEGQQNSVTNDIDKVKEKLESLSLKPQLETRRDYLETNGEKKTTEESAKRELQSQRSSEERRIRNKDRPSIAIYQPKARLMLSDETTKEKPLTSSGAALSSDGESKRKEERQRSKRSSRRSETSNAAPMSSDGETKRKDDSTRSKKKVVRYSHRRAEMRAEKRLERSAKHSSENIDKIVASSNDLPKDDHIPSKIFTASEATIANAPTDD